MTTLYLTHPVCLEHDTGDGHPERPDRLRAIYTALDHDIFKDLVREEAPSADLEDLERAHPKAYIEAIKAAVPKEGLVRVDADTTLSPVPGESVSARRFAKPEAIVVGLRSPVSITTSG